MFKRTTGFATPLSVIVATLLVLWATLANAQQPPAVTLVNGDIDGDNEVTLFDYGIVVANFGLSEQDPGFNPEADLDGDTEVTLFDFGIVVNHFGEIGVDALTGVEQPMEEGLSVPGTDMEGGLMFHAAGRQGTSYPRWQPYLNVARLTRTPKRQPVLGGDPRNPRNHILYDSSNGLFGYDVDMPLNPVDFPFGLFWVKLTMLSVRAYDLFAEDEAFSHTYVGFAPPVPATGEGVRVRRVHSIAQTRQAVGSRGYARSGSFIMRVGVDYDPLIFGVDLGQPAEVYRYRNGSFSWQRWTEDLSSQPGSAGVFPSLQQNPIFVLDERVGEGGRYTRYYREIISIDLSR